MDLVARGYAKETRQASHPAASRGDQDSLSKNGRAVPGRRPRGAFYRSFGKRAFDLAFAAAGLLMAAPLILFLMLLVWVEGGRPIFRHARVGQGGRSFGCLKIRSMRPDAEAALAAILAADPAAAAEWAADQKLTNDPRVTRIGSFLRKSSLDELPQLVNVLRGEMSVVGPRPITAGEVARYGAFADSYMAVRPGLTGPWQVSGRNDISFDERVALDAGYARSHSLAGDVAIVAKTAVSILRLTGK